MHMHHWSYMHHMHHPLSSFPLLYPLLTLFWKALALKSVEAKKNYCCKMIVNYFMTSDREVNMLNLFLPFLFDQRLETVKSAFLDQFNIASRSGVRIPSVLCDKQFCYQLNYDIYCFVQLSWLQLGNNIEMQLLADAAAEEQNWKLTANRESVQGCRRQLSRADIYQFHSI